MANINSTIAETTIAYPAAAVSATLTDEFIAVTRRTFDRKGSPLTIDDQDLARAVIDIDSLTAVEILCVLDDILPFQVGESVICAGGYMSIGEAVEKIVGRVEKEWVKHHNGGKS